MNLGARNFAPLQDCAPSAEDFRREVLAGLRMPKKTLPCKYFYDERGSQLFDRICALEEYYLTRTELAIMRAHAGEMAEALGPGCVVVEFGSGSGIKIRLLLEHLKAPAAYIPVDISRAHLLLAAAGLARDFPALRVVPVCADFCGSFELPSCGGPGSRTAVYFPGSTIGNFPPKEATSLLENMGSMCGKGGAVLIGVDLKKDRAVLEAAYNDREGVTRDFNRNILRRINRELGADFRLDRFEHRAVYNADQGRIELHLVSRAAQTVSLDGVKVRFEEGESIHTENSYKFSLEEFAEVAAGAGFSVGRVWMDADRLFSVQYLVRG